MKTNYHDRIKTRSKFKKKHTVAKIKVISTTKKKS